MSSELRLRSIVISLAAAALFSNSAVAQTPAKILAYEAFYRGIMGMGVAYWEMDGN